MFSNFGAERRRSLRHVRAGKRLLSMPRLEALEERMLLASDSAFSGADAAAMADFFVTDNVTITLPSENPAIADRTFATFSQAEDASWIGRLYVDLLGRPGEGGEISSWLDQLQSGTSRAQVIDRFLASPEYLRGLIDDVYQEFLLRTAGEIDLTYWTAQFASGMNQSEFVAQVTASHEYAARVQAVVGRFQSVIYVQSLYENLLGRTQPPTTDELTFWTTQMGAGASRLEVSRGFLASAEFQELLVNDPIDLHVFAGWYQNYLNREADSAGLDFWRASFASGSTWEQVQQGFLLSEEFALG